MKIKIFVGALLVGFLAGCSFVPPSIKPQELVVFAASSLTDAFSALEVAYEDRHEDVDVVLNFASSSQLAAQLNEGIAADVFASANPTQMHVVIEGGRIEAGTEKLFVSNRLVVITPTDNPANITSLEDLANKGVALVLAVEGVPVRQYTDQIVSRLPAEFQERIYANLVSEEDNVRQVSAKIALGEADAGVVYTSDVTPDIQGMVQQISIPDAQNVVATYPIAPWADTANPALAQSFIYFVLSAEGQTILAERGFGAPPNK
ncbi:MAG: molybdate ABC transporter substrate-binding protein [Anaerolineales bacterium]